MQILLWLFLAPFSWAYIPEYSMITAHTADQHGRGAYLVEQDVTYRKDSDAYTIKETWLVADENHMRLTLEGRGPLKNLVQGSEIFTGGRRYFVDISSTPSSRNQRLGEEWLEPLFYFRSAKYFRARLVNLKVAPPESLTERAPLSSDADPNYQPPGFIRLSRVGGAIDWAIGLPPNSGSHPTLWIEQDQFVVRKYKNGDQLSLKAGDYGKFDQGFWYPRQRSYTFGPYTVEINTLQVRSLGKLRSDDVRFRASALSGPRDNLRLPDMDALKEFYARFR